MKSYSIDDWCKLHGISRSYFYKLQNQGQAPTIYKIGRCTRISEAANNEWVKAREAASQAEAA
jgi:predicted DNA-binding transcriptional regulator AlpA